jgi:hypothetical protein
VAGSIPLFSLPPWTEPCCFLAQCCKICRQMQTPVGCVLIQSTFLVWGKGVGAFAALHPLIFFTSLMHFPSVTRVLKTEDSDSALYRLRKEMEEFHLSGWIGHFWKTPTWHRDDSQPGLPGWLSTQATGSWMVITCKHHREQTLG